MDPYKLLSRYLRELGAGAVVLILAIVVLYALVHWAFGGRQASADVPLECRPAALQLISPCTRPRGP